MFDPTVLLMAVANDAAVVELESGSWLGLAASSSAFRSYSANGHRHKVRSKRFDYCHIFCICFRIPALCYLLPLSLFCVSSCWSSRSTSTSNGWFLGEPRCASPPLSLLVLKYTVTRTATASQRFVLVVPLFQGVISTDMRSMIPSMKRIIC